MRNDGVPDRARTQLQSPLSLYRATIAHEVGADKEASVGCVVST